MFFKKYAKKISYMLLIFLLILKIYFGIRFIYVDDMVSLGLMQFGEALVVFMLLVNQIKKRK